MKHVDPLVGLAGLAFLITLLLMLLPPLLSADQVTSEQQRWQQVEEEWHDQRTLWQRRQIELQRKQDR